MSDQASGLRKWASLQRQQQQVEATIDTPAEHAVEQASCLLTPLVITPPEPGKLVPPSPKMPLVVVGLPGSGSLSINKVKTRLGQWAALGRSWAGDPDAWEVRIVMADTADLAQLCNEYSRWALWISSDADDFAAMYRALRQLAERDGPRRLLALHEPHLPRQGLLANLRSAAEYYLQMELLVLAR